MTYTAEQFSPADHRPARTPWWASAWMVGPLALLVGILTGAGLVHAATAVTVAAVVPGVVGAWRARTGRPRRRWRRR